MQHSIFPGFPGKVDSRKPAYLHECRFCQLKQTGSQGRARKLCRHDKPQAHSQMAFAEQKKCKNLDRNQQQHRYAECQQSRPWWKANDQAFKITPNRQTAQRGKAGCQGFPAPFFEQQK